MFEYKKYPSGYNISITPMFILYIEPEDDSRFLTRIKMIDGSDIIVEAPYDVVKQHIANYMPPQ